ncbi:MAG TPA: helix-turn-helix domain-containing protein [Firmicutes bacterium]|nr:helix-turn-helix domain-containing protein [Bacillota bacterium]
MLDNEQESGAYDFGIRLRSLRRARGLSQADAAKLLGISKNSLYRYECNSQEPTLNILVRLARCYNTTLDYIAGLEDAAVVAVYGLPPEKKKLFRDFVREFVECGGKEKR